MSGLRTIEEIISEKIGDRSHRFVFPSAVAADFWTRRILEAGVVRAVDRERFAAWDRFKELTLSADRSDRKAANGAVRNLFSAAFLAENAAEAKNGKAPLRELILPAFADDWNSFVPSLSRTLPALDGFFGRAERSGLRLDDDPYFSDLLRIRSAYADFLERHGLFEPAWDRAPFRARSSSWTIFFPELIADWPEYESELAAAPEVRAVRGQDIGKPFEPARVPAGFAPLDAKLVRFGTAQEELSAAVRFVEALLDDGGVAVSDIAVSVPAFSDYEERLALEFRLRDLPASLRKGRPLPEHPAGRLFSALAACRATRWSYRAVKDLLLDGAYPWKKRGDRDALLDFGLRFRCVSGFPENGREVDVWESSFDRLRDLSGVLRVPVPAVAQFYRTLKREVEAILGARSFADLKRRFLEFKSNRFDEPAMDGATDRVFSKAMDELTVLAETEERLRGLRIPDPYSLFLTHLKSVEYVHPEKEPGINVYDYRVAAGIAPAVHIVLNATQGAASVPADPAPFLREDRKLRAAVEERDLSAAFLEAYGKSGALVVFTAADRGFSGYATPHPVLLGERFKPEAPAFELAGGRPDPYETELRGEKAGDLPAAATSIQLRAKKRADLVRGRRKDARFSPLDGEELKAALIDRLCGGAEDPRVSPTDLNEAAACPFAWLLKRGLGIGDSETEIETVDSRDLGMLYHRILERFFLRVSEEDPRFRSERLDAYRDLLFREIDEALEERRLAEGAFQESVYEMYKTRMRSSLAAFLADAAPLFDGRTVLGAELPLRREYPEYGIALSGKADLVFASDTDALTVYDFKTGKTPAAASLVPDPTGALGDYQMAAYVRMLEAGRSGKVEEASFYSIENRETRSVVSAERKPGRSGRPCGRDAYEADLLSVDEAVEATASLLRGGYFPVPPPGRRDVCAGCRVSAVCRLPFDGGSDERNG